MAESNHTASVGEETSRTPEASPSSRLLWWLGGSAFVSWWLYVALTWISRSFAYEVPGPDRPLLPTLAIFAALFGLYVFQVAIAKRVSTERETTRLGKAEPRQAESGETEQKKTETGAMPLIIVFCVAFRLLLLFSEPIQEVDAYRYLWDGKVIAAGVSPFRYSPQHILQADVNHDHPTDVIQLIQLRDQSVSNAQILSRVHFGNLTTVYPPVSQAVFAVAAFVTPNSTSVQNHLLIIKAFIVAFDLATFGVLILLLKHVRRPPEWSIAYGWCPLVMKEFANSGHLDSIAVFLSVATVYCALKAFYPRLQDTRSGDTPPSGKGQSKKTTSRPATYQWTFLAALVLSLAIGAKIYPIVLAPLLFLSAWQKVGRLAAVLASAIVLTLTIVMVTPMLFREQPDSDVATNLPAATDTLPPLPTMVEASESDIEIPETRLPSTTLPVAAKPKFTLSENALSENASTEATTLEITHTPHTKANPANTGLSAFASKWQMNDFLFLLISENLRGEGQGSTTWFAITPMQWRESVINFVVQNSSLRRSQVPFLTTRIFTSILFIIVAIWLAWKIKRSESPEAWLEIVFLTLAWFWLLQPTQNPWYWTWALPFIPFARSRAWLAMSGLVLVYYARFWFSYHASENPIAGTPYVGVAFFDYVVTWLEFAPWFLWLMWTAANHSRLVETRIEARSNKSPD